jgi:hypothetical protein
MNTDQLTRYLAETFPKPPVPEQTLVMPLIARFTPFRNFYLHERKHITIPVYWYPYGGLPAGINGRCVTVMNGPQWIVVIQLNETPASAADAYWTAHELAHLLLTARGFPHVLPTQPGDWLASALHSMLSDLHVDAILLKYGFDVCGAFEREVQNARQELEQYPDVPQDPRQCLRWLFNVTGNLLEWQLLTLAAGEPEQPHDYLVWIEQRYPDLAAEAHDLAYFVNALGFDTPAKMRDALAALVQRYELTHLQITTATGGNHALHQ